MQNLIDLKVHILNIYSRTLLMAGGPRKFSEKIALLNQKEAEGNAAFASIMGEVKSIVSLFDLILFIKQKKKFKFKLKSDQADQIAAVSWIC